MSRMLMVVVLVTVVLAAPAGCRTAGAGGEVRVAIPSTFPADIPLPEAAVIQAAQDLGDKGVTVQFSTQKEPVAAAAAYRERLVQAGWRLVARAVDEDDDFMSFHKGDRAVAVGVSRTERGVGIGITFAMLR